MIMWEHTTVPMNTVAQVCFGSDEKQQFEPKLALMQASAI